MWVWSSTVSRLNWVCVRPAGRGRTRGSYECLLMVAVVVSSSPNVSREDKRARSNAPRAFLLGGLGFDQKPPARVLPSPFRFLDRCINTAPSDRMHPPIPTEATLVALNCIELDTSKPQTGRVPRVSGGSGSGQPCSTTRTRRASCPSSTASGACRACLDLAALTWLPV